jgi:hypothetical protein
MYKFLFVLLVFICSCQIKEGKNICEEVKVLPDSPGITILGDSIMVFSHANCYTIPGLISLHMKQNIKYYAKDASFLLGSNITEKNHDVYSQYEKARKHLPGLHTILMDGGAIDIFVRCVGADDYPKCTNAIDGMLLNLEKLFMRMRQDGIVNICYLGYYHMKGYFGIFKEGQDEGITKLQVLCQKYDVIFYDPRSLFDAHSDYYFVDGVHPSAKGTEALVNLITSRMY